MRSRSWAGQMALAVGLVVVAAVLTGAVGQEVAGQTAPEPGAPSSPAPSSGPSAPVSPEDQADLDHEANVLLVWGHGGTDSSFSNEVRELPGVVAVSAVRLDRRDLASATTAGGQPAAELPANWVYPLDTAAIDPADHAAVLGTAAEGLAGLAPGQALLGETSAALRGLGVGAVVTLADGSTRDIVGVVDDRVAGYPELVVHPDDPADVDIERYLLVRHTGDAEAVTAAIRNAASEELRIRPMADAMYPRHGDGVLPQVVIKTHFGEFAMLDVAGRRVQVGQTWRWEYLETRTLPHVGLTVCHRVVMDAFEAVLNDLADQGLLGHINPSQYQGCWLGRVIGASRTLSHHSWGLAVDVNVNPADVFTANLSQAVIDTFERHGFVWGGDFLRPDEPHFEYVGDLLEDR